MNQQAEMSIKSRYMQSVYEYYIEVDIFLSELDGCNSRVTFASANLRFLSQKFHLPVQTPKRGSSHGYHRMTKEYLGRLPVMMMIRITGGKSWGKLTGTPTPRMAVT